MKKWKKYSSSGIYKTRYQNELFIVTWKEKITNYHPPISAAPQSFRIN